MDTRPPPVHTRVAGVDAATASGRATVAGARGATAPCGPRTFGYARVSTSEQTTALQYDALVRAGVAPEHIAYDEATSGTIPAQDRTGWAAVMSQAQAGDTVVVYALSRLGRSTLDVLTTVQALADAGIGLRSVTEALDTSTPVGRAMLSILAVVCQLERDMLAERIRDGIAASRARGVHVGRKPSDKSAVLTALQAGQSVAQAAESTGMSPSTVRRVARAMERAMGG